MKFNNLAYQQYQAGAIAGLYVIFLAISLFVILCWLCIKTFAFAGLANKFDALKAALVAEIYALLEFAETFQTVWESSSFILTFILTRREDSDSGRGKAP